MPFDRAVGRPDLYSQILEPALRNEALGEPFGPFVNFVEGRPQALLAAVHEDGVDQEEDAVDDGDGSLGETVVLQGTPAHVLEVLHFQRARGDEQSAPQQTEVDVLQHSRPQA